ncbi:transcriptional regulator AraC N-terminal domain protein [Actinobacillus ureae ATCC 25976]|uniref:Transcriptional regulator AraC N-terminal domain protein n=1 Tax=Actinobacillus ureae ATCC 25976 TaxID=887324 RepID=E8KK68_9PAST|nr:AraC family transcriptional regulator [Actinobacillus ureae]EFX90715.1 transcriptional regulator AraC N-terminal domain protein [Actinobacillus ureae ATCC 25976]
MKREESDEKLQQIAESIKEFTAEEGCFYTTEIQTLSLCRRNHTTNPMPCIYPLSLFLVVQGSQHVNFGESVMEIHRGQTALTTLDLSVVSNVLNASRHEPYLSLRIELDAMLLRELDEQTQWQPTTSSLSDSLSVFPADEDLLDSILRLMKLLKTPKLKSYLRPLVEREIALRLLASDHHAMLRRLFTQGTIEQKIAKVIAYFNEHYAEKIEMDRLAEMVFTSPSSLRQHFRKITGTSPLQYQKQLRLQHARRLMFKQNFDATSAAMEVGYESPNQFNREYACFFGEPPLRDIHRLKEDEMHFGRIV